MAVCTADPWAVEARVMGLLRLAVVVRDPTEPPVLLRNGVFALQSTFLEVSAPGAPEAAMARFLERHGGDAGYMVCLQVDDLAGARARAAALGVREVLVVDRRRVGDATISSVHLHPSDTGGTLLSFEEPDPPDSWAWAGLAWRDYRRGDVVQDIVGVGLVSRAPDALAARLASLLGVPADGRSLALDGGRIVVEEAPAGVSRDRLSTIELLATDRARAGEEHVLAGTTLRFV